MPITTIVLNVTDVERSVAFYTDHLQAKLLGAVTEAGATLDVLTATLELVAVGPQAPASTWVPDDLQRGFRHVGFKVDRVDPYVERLKDAGVQFHLEPIEAEGGVRITFFRDPDGTLLELVERDLQYTRVLDEAGVAAERAQGVPERPRFDHVALTVHDLHATEASYAPLGFTPIGAIAQPHDARGFDIHYLKSGDTVLEVFTYGVDKTGRAPQLDAPGYVAAVLATGTQGQAGPGAVAAPGLRPVGAVGGRTVHADGDGFTTVLGG
ncbi:VOC family protein [Kineococcus sp. SYSU DK005]|uniref:VOC family protein n=1 Tax=Kineococcus sp. SYSU DK005 TaxID=3383126 RepID=UPI003D7D8B24